MAYTARERGLPGFGWVNFAAVILIMGGIMRIIDAFWAFDKDDEIGEQIGVLLFSDDLAAYGWLWLVVGIIMIAAGIGVLTGSTWARWAGIVVAAISAIAAMLWIYEFPVWALVTVGISVSIIYALATYGSRRAVEEAP
jgi:hypothetical protein